MILVRGPLTLGPSQYAWFRVSFGPQGPCPDLVAAEKSRRQLTAFVAQVQNEYGVGPSQTVIAGFSQGGIMSASAGLTAPHKFRGFGILSGRILPEIEPLIAKREALSTLQGFIAHGRNDTKLSIDWAYKTNSLLTNIGVTHEIHLYSGAHSISTAIHNGFIDWVERVLQ